MWQKDWHEIFHIIPGINPRPISALQLRCRAWYGSLRLIPGPIWKMSCNNLLLSRNKCDTNILPLISMCNYWTLYWRHFEELMINILSLISMCNYWTLYWRHFEELIINILLLICFLSKWTSHRNSHLRLRLWCDIALRNSFS